MAVDFISMVINMVAGGKQNSRVLFPNFSKNDGIIK